MNVCNLLKEDLSRRGSLIEMFFAFREQNGIEIYLKRNSVSTYSTKMEMSVNKITKICFYQSNKFSIY